MKGRPTLYELLGVLPHALLADIKAGYRSEVNALEARRSALQPQVFTERMQMLRVACDTLTDAISRAGYDAKLLAAAARTAPPSAGRTGTAAASLALAMNGDPHAAAASADVRADALAMRADALALRAEAIMLRGGSAPGHLGAVDLAQGALTGVKRMVRAIGLLVVIGIAAFGITRCASNGSAHKRQLLEASAGEQAALQEYFQTHGVRPANITEMQLLEAARQRNETVLRQAEQHKRTQQQEITRFEEESRRLGERVSQDLRRQEEGGRRRAERERVLKEQAEQLKLEAELARSEPDRRRLELRRKQILEQINQL
jgi:curved DNA-binding protein CbpA